MFKNGIIVLMIATTMAVSSTAQDGYKVGIEFTHRWDEMDREESNGPTHKLLRNHLAKYNQDQSDENVGGGRVQFPYNFNQDANDDVGGGRVYGEYNKGPYKAGGEYNWDEAEESVGFGRMRMCCQAMMPECLKCQERNRRIIKAGAEYNWDEDANVGGPRNYPPIPPPFLDDAEENVGFVFRREPCSAKCYLAQQKFCRYCGGTFPFQDHSKECRTKCWKRHEDELRKACGFRPLMHSVDEAEENVGGERVYGRKLGRVSANCYFTQQNLCGYCGGSNECRMKCNKKHENKLRKACGFRRLIHSVENGRGRSLRRRLIRQTPAVRYMEDNCKWGCRFSKAQFIKKFGRQDAMYAINNRGSINYK
jgi:hypothetical protein